VSSTQEAELEQRIQVAVARKDYAGAAALQQELEALQQEAAKLASARHEELEQAVQAAVAARDFAAAAKLQAELDALGSSAAGVGLAC
jgi:hypothetical protein